MNMYIYINLNKWPYLSFNFSVSCFSHLKVSIIQVVFIHFLKYLIHNKSQLEQDY